MKASELRIWNLVNYPNWNNDGKDYIFMVRDIFYEQDKIGLTTGVIQTKVNFDHIKPIPLTEECLLKFGFEYVKMYNSYVKKFTTEHHSSEVIIRKEDFVVCDMDIRIKLNHVHQLQNLYFALTGEELTIKEQ